MKPLNKAKSQVRNVQQSLRPSVVRLRSEADRLRAMADDLEELAERLNDSFGAAIWAEELLNEL